MQTLYQGVAPCINPRCVRITPFARKFAFSRKFPDRPTPVSAQNRLGTGVAQFALMVWLFSGGPGLAGPRNSSPPVPAAGNFHSLQHPDQPPLPFDPFPSLPLYSLGDDHYAFDDRTVDYALFQTADADSGPPVPPGGGGGGGTYTNAPSYSPNYGPNDLWLAITNVPDDAAVDVVLNGLKADKYYQLLLKTDLNEHAWTLGPVYFNAAQFGLTNHDFGEFSSADSPMKYFEAVEGTNQASIVATTNNAVEPGPGNTPAARDGSFSVFRQRTGSALTVYYTISGTASNGVDYTTITNFVTFQANDDTKLITIHPLADSVIEFEEPVVLTLLLTNGYVIDPTAPAAMITINDYFPTNLFTTNLFVNAPIGIDYSPSASALLASVNYESAGSGGSPFNFLKINSNGTTNQWSGVANLPGEIKLATVKTTANGFTQGDLYFGNGTVIGKLNASGTVSNLNWATLTNGVVTNPDELRGGLYVDQTGTWSNNLIVVTSPEDASFSSDHGVWRVESNGIPHLVTTINTFHLEGVVTLTNDVAKWGPWAGKIITGDENLELIYAVDTNGVTTAFDLGIDPEDFDIIQTNQDLYCLDPFGGPIGAIGRMMKLSKSLLTNYVGDLVITHSGETDPNGQAKLFIVHWDNSKTNFVTRSITYTFTDGVTHRFEHVTFAPISLPNLP